MQYYKFQTTAWIIMPVFSMQSGTCPSAELLRQLKESNHSVLLTLVGLGADDKTNRFVNEIADSQKLPAIIYEHGCS